MRKEEVKEAKSFFRKSNRRLSYYKSAMINKSATPHKSATVSEPYRRVNEDSVRSISYYCVAYLSYNKRLLKRQAFEMW